MIPQNIINAYASGPASPVNGQYKEDDLVANFPGCNQDKRSCAEEMTPFFDILDRKARGSD